MGTTDLLKQGGGCWFRTISGWFWVESGVGFTPKRGCSVSEQMMNNMGGDDDVDLPEVDGADDVSMWVE